MSVRVLAGAGAHLQISGKTAKLAATFSVKKDATD